MGFELTVLIPVFNDWHAAELLLSQLDEVCSSLSLRPRVVLVDDGSTTARPAQFLSAQPKSLSQVDCLDLHLNLGHQRALCVGLVHLGDSLGDDSVVLVMDSDGEDAPQDIPALLAEYRKHDGSKFVFAGRARRAEGLIFRTGYQFYRMVHLALVGFDIRIGNFSLLSGALLQRLTRSSDLWNHYAAAVVKSRLPMTTIPLNRDKRLSGQSQMNFVSLVAHGLSAMSVYSQTIGVRLLMAALVLMLTGAIALGVVAISSFGTTLAIPRWITSASGLLVLVLLQVFMISLMFTFGILAGRSSQPFIPVRDCPLFVARVSRIYPRQ